MRVPGLLILVALCVPTTQAHARAGVVAQDASDGARQISSSAVALKLSSPYASVRREAAEELARLAAAEHRRLVEGYWVQEKDARVRLALAWALYRMGKNESLFALVRALDEKKLAEQSVAYLKQLEAPDPLYVFLGHVNGNTQIRLLEALAAVGDRATLERIRPFTESTDPGIADAAKFAEREINIRLEETPKVEPKRPRKVGNEGETEPPSF
jgi:HEAT repeat protein